MTQRGATSETPTMSLTADGPRTIRAVSVLVPVVERADDLLAVYSEFAEQLESESLDYEFLFVFDGDFMQPPESLLNWTREDGRVHILRFDRRFGEAAALRAGIDRSSRGIIITVPAYFQVQPSGLRSVLAALHGGADLVVTRRSPRLDGLFNRVQSRLFHALVRSVSGFEFSDMACGLRAMKREIAETIPLYGDLHRFIPALAAREGYRVEEVSVPQHPLDARRRLYRPGVYLRRLLDILTFFFLAKFTEKPLRFFGLIGCAFLGAGGVISTILLFQRLAGTGIANRPLLLLGVLLIALGVQLVGLGLVGEIIVHLRSPRRGSYRVRETVP
jgi:glycosyltransferase involved in cell wall biosynthesis